MRTTRGIRVVCGVVCSLIVGCGSGSSSPADGARATAAAAVPGSVVLYDDALASGWADWSWGSTRNFSNTSPVAAGTGSLAVTFDAYGGLYFRRTAGSVGGMATLQLSVNGGTTSGQQIQLAAVQGSSSPAKVNLATYCTGATIPANAWTRCTVPLSALLPSGGTIDGIALQLSEGAGRPAMYFDDVALVPAVTAPAAPTNVQVVAASTSITVTWTASSGATGYDVYRSVGSAGAWTKVTASPQAGTTYVDTAVTPDTGYSYRVTASNAGGTSAASASAGAVVPPTTTPTTAAPATPTNVKVVAASTSMTVTWTASSGATGYDVYRSVGSSGVWAKVTASPQSGTTYVDTAVAASTGYWYQVTASNAGGTSAATTAVGAVVPAASTTTPTVPAAPTNVAAVASASSVVLSWSACSGATGYDVYRATSSGGTFTRLTTSSQTAVSYTDTAVTAGSSYWYQVRAVNAAGTSPASATVSATPTTTTPTVRVSISPSAPTMDACGTQQFTASVTGTSDPTVTWSLQEGAAGGTIDGNGLYTAANGSGTVHVVATTHTTPAVSSTVTVVVQQRILSMAVTPVSTQLLPGGSARFAATITTTCGTFAAQ